MTTYSNTRPSGMHDWKVNENKKHHFHSECAHQGAYCTFALKIISEKDVLT